MTSRRRLLQGLALTSLAPRMVKAAVPESWTQTFDVIVVGGGGAGLAASVAAAQNGASVCLIGRRHAAKYRLLFVCGAQTPEAQRHRGFAGFALSANDGSGRQSG